MWRRRDVAIAARCSEAMFSLTEDEESERSEGVEVFKYSGQLLDRSYDNWPTVLRNIRKARQVWGRLWKLIQREEAEPAFLSEFYHDVVQAVLLFGAYTWVILAPMAQRLEGAHVVYCGRSQEKRQSG